MKRKEIDKVWTLSLTFVVLETCYAIWLTSEHGLEGILSFIQPLLLVSITAGLLKFQKKGWVILWMGLFILGYLANVVSKETALGMLGSFILSALIGVPVCCFFMKWTKAIWRSKKEIEKVGF